MSKLLTRAHIRSEIGIVLLLSLGASAIYSIVSIVYRLTSVTPLNQQTATINRPLSDQAIFDLIYQLLSISLGVVPVALVMYLLWVLPGRMRSISESGIESAESIAADASMNPFTRLGFDFTRIWQDIGFGLALCAAIGIPGLVLYLGGRAMNITVTIVPTVLDSHWWTVPVLVLLALKAALLEEVILNGYLFARLRLLNWTPWKIIVAVAILRASYHLYQGIGPFFGNLVMGVVFAWVYQRWGRMMPLVIAHFVIDLVSFVGYPLALTLFPGIF
ncbi:MAG: CPBP family intramembrane glutamic endopeptidase [Microbacteriaceae bacterium]